jgi:hypothetical protein
MGSANVMGHLKDILVSDFFIKTKLLRMENFKHNGNARRNGQASHKVYTAR